MEWEQLITSESDIFIEHGGHNFYVRGDGVPLTFDIMLYRNSAPAEMLNKSNYLQYVGVISGIMREPSNIIRPSILIEYAAVPDFNYIWIGALNRWYYVRNISTDVKGLFSINCEVDVFMTFRNEIRLNYAWITRNEFVYNKNLYDPRYVKTVTPSFEYRECSNNEFNVEDGHTATLRANYLLVIACKPVDFIQHGRSDPLGSIAPLVRPIQTYNNEATANRMYLLTYDKVKSVMAELYDNNDWSSNFKSFFTDPNQAVISLIQYPFDIFSHDMEGCTDVMDYIKYGNEVALGTKAQYIKPIYNSVFDDVGVLDTTPLYYDWRDYEPAAKYSIYLPYCGWLPLKAEEIVGNLIEVKYVVDMPSGRCKAIVQTGPKSENPRIFAQISGQIGFRMPITSSNHVEVLKENISNGANLLTTAALAGAGAMSPTAAGAAAIGTATSMAMNQPTFRGMAGDSTIERFNPYRVGLLIERESFTPEGIGYADHVGRPLETMRRLNSIGGYTEMRNVKLYNIPGALADEMDMIKSKLLEGVIL